MLSGRQSLASIGAQVGIALTAIICATVLCGLGKLDAAAVTAIFGTALGLAGATAAVTSNTTTVPTVSPTKVTTPEGVTVLTNGAIDADSAERRRAPDTDAPAA